MALIVTVGIASLALLLLARIRCTAVLRIVEMYNARRTL